MTTSDYPVQDEHASPGGVPAPRRRGKTAAPAPDDVLSLPRPAVTVDVALLTVREGQLRTLLVRRDREPASGEWSLPGGVVGLDEPLDDAAARVLKERASVTGVFAEQLYTFGAPGRDPRTRVIGVAYYALVDAEALDQAVNSHAAVARAIVKGTDAGIRVARLVVPWDGESGGPVGAEDDAGEALPLAFDHAEILGAAVKRIRGKLGYATIGFELLPSRFSLAELRHVHETITGRPMNKDSFRRRILDRGRVSATGQRAAGVGHRPPQLYRFSDPQALAAVAEVLGTAPGSTPLPPGGPPITLRQHL